MSRGRQPAGFQLVREVRVSKFQVLGGGAKEEEEFLVRLDFIAQSAWAETKQNKELSILCFNFGDCP